MKAVRPLLRRILPIVLVLGAWAPSAFPVRAQLASTPVAAQSIDLAWIALTPADLPEVGYAQYISTASSAMGYAAESAAAGGLRDRLAEELQDAGWQQAYKSWLVLPSAAHPDQPDRVVRDIVSRWSDEASAARAIALLQASLVISGWHLATPAPQVGDTALLLEQSAGSDGSAPSQWRRLLARDGAFLIDVWVIDTTTTGTPASELIRLVGVLRQRVREVRADTSPGLSDAVYRLDPAQLTKLWEGYRRRGGVQLAWYGQTPERFAAMDAYYRNLGVIDVYRYSSQSEGPNTYQVDILHFASEDEAVGHLRELARKELGTELGTPIPDPPEVSEVTDLPPLGDESLIVTFRAGVPRALGTPAYMAWIRIDDRVAEMTLIRLDRPSGVDVGELQRLAQAELHCLQSGGCWEGTATLEASS